MRGLPRCSPKQVWAIDHDIAHKSPRELCLVPHSPFKSHTPPSLLLLLSLSFPLSLAQTYGALENQQALPVLLRHAELQGDTCV